MCTLILFHTVSGISSCITTTSWLVSQKMRTSKTCHVFNQHKSAYVSIRGDTSINCTNLSQATKRSAATSGKQVRSKLLYYTIAWDEVRGFKHVNSRYLIVCLPSYLLQTPVFKYFELTCVWNHGIQRMKFLPPNSENLPLIGWSCATRIAWR